MDLWFVIPAITAVLGGSSIFLFSRSLHNFQKFVGFTFIFEGLSLLLGGSILAPGAPFFSPTYLLYLAMMLLTPFFYYFAVKYLLKEDGVKGRDFWMLVVVAVYIISCAVIISRVPESDRAKFFAWIQGIAPGSKGVGPRVLFAQDTLAYVFCLAEYLFILIFSIINIFKYRRLMASYYSNLEKSRSAEIIVAFIVLRFIAVIATLFHSGSAQGEWIAIARTAIICLFYIVAAIYVCKVTHTAEELSLLVKSRDQKAAPKTPAADEIISSRIGKLIENKFFLNPDVNLMDLSSEIGVNSKYVSEYLRFHYGETFLIFVNRLRVEHAQKLLAETSLPIADIAEQSGYISVSTFFRNFTKINGNNPSEYRENTKSSVK
jgi:Response regulator containing CheY-like receiver domain and AraC-type DNA-binding domain